MIHSPGVFLCVCLSALVFVFPKESYSVIATCALEIQIMVLNFRMKRIQKRLYKQLCEDAKTMGLPEPPPFKFTPIQERNK